MNNLKKAGLAGLLAAGAAQIGGCGAIVGGYLIAESQEHAAQTQAQATRDAAMIAAGKKPEWQCPWDDAPESRIGVNSLTLSCEGEGTLSFYKEGMHFLGRRNAYATIPYASVYDVEVKESLFADIVDIKTRGSTPLFRFLISGVNIHQLERAVEERAARARGAP